MCLYMSTHMRSVYEKYRCMYETCGSHMKRNVPHMKYHGLYMRIVYEKYRSIYETYGSHMKHSVPPVRI